MEISNRTTARNLIQAMILILGLISTASATDFYVGGKDGWVPNPSESFNQWAGRMRFQVHDRLVFKYPKGEEDSVLEVSMEGYDSCNASVAIQKVDSTFEFGRSGSFYFISGANGSCAAGQKLKVVVMADRRNPVPTPSPSPPSPSPSPPSPSPSPPSSSPSPSSDSPSPSSLSPSPSSDSPSPSSDSPSPSSESPSPSPSPSSGSSSPSPSVSDSPSPSSSNGTPPLPSPSVSTSPGPSPSENKQSLAFTNVPSFSVGLLILILATVLLL